ISGLQVAVDGSNDWLIQFDGPADPTTTANYSVEVWDDNFAHLKGVLPVTFGTSHAVLLNAEALDGSGGGPIDEEDPVVSIAHTDKNNLFSRQGLVSEAFAPIRMSGVSFEKLDATWQRFDFTLQWLGADNYDFVTNSGLSAVAALQHRTTTDPVSGHFAPDLTQSPFSVHWSAGSTLGKVLETYKSYGTTLSSAEVDPGYGSGHSVSNAVVSRKGRRFTFLLSGNEYRLYVGYSGVANEKPVAIVSGGSGLNFPFRFTAELLTASDESLAINGFG